MSTPLDVTIFPAEPGSGYVLAIERDPFDEDESISAVLDLGPVVAWRFETYGANTRVYTVRRPVGIEPDPPGDDWTIEMHTDREAHLRTFAAAREAVGIYERRHHITEENPS